MYEAYVVIDAQISSVNQYEISVLKLSVEAQACTFHCSGGWGRKIVRAQYLWP